MGLTPPRLDPSHASRAAFGLCVEVDRNPRRGDLPASDWDSYERLKGRRGEAEACIAICKAGAPHFDDVYLAAGDGYVQVDHVALVGSVFVVVEAKNYAGTLGAAPGGGLVQTLPGGRAVALARDPRRQVAAHVAALRAFLPNRTEVVGVVAMAGAAGPGEALPDGIVRMRALAGVLAAHGARRPAGEDAYGDWWALHRHAADRDWQERAAAEHRARWLRHEGP